MTHIENMQSELGAIAESGASIPVDVPPELAALPVMEALKLRLVENVARLGGYQVLAAALNSYAPRTWQSKIEGGGTAGLTSRDLLDLVAHFGDQVLIALVARHSGGMFLPMDAIADSEFSASDLNWMLRRKHAEGLLLICDYREAKMENQPCEPILEAMTKNAREISILVRQLERKMNPPADRKA